MNSAVWVENSLDLDQTEWLILWRPFFSFSFFVLRDICILTVRYCVVQVTSVSRDVKMKKRIEKYYYTSRKHPYIILTPLNPTFIQKN